MIAKLNPEINIMEIRFFHIITTVMGALLLGVISYIALNSADIPRIKEQISAMDTRYTTTITWQTEKLSRDDAQLESHERRIQKIEDDK